MQRKLVIESSKGGRRVIEYWKLSVPELEKRIGAYEKKHGMSYARFERGYDCGSAEREETRDLLDWENLIEEKQDRTRTGKSGGKREMAYQKG